MADAATATATAVTIPDELKAKYPELLDFIMGSESMNNEERQYWINILPIMTPEQIKQLKDILVNERQQLAAIDAKYAKEIDQIGQEELTKETTEDRRKKRSEREQTEASARSREQEEAERLLSQSEPPPTGKA